MCLHVSTLRYQWLSYEIISITNNQLPITIKMMAISDEYSMVREVNNFQYSSMSNYCDINDRQFYTCIALYMVSVISCTYSVR